MDSVRDKLWEGFINARDLGGLSLKSGGVTRFGAIVRSEHPAHLRASGWEALWDYGIRTIVSLETGNLDADEALRANPAVEIPTWLGQIDHHRVAVEDGRDAEFMRTWAASGLWGTPLYFSDALSRWPALHAEAVSTIANARGGVLIHCGRGHDRTGIMSLLLLALAGAEPQAISEDYLRSSQRLAARDPADAGSLFERVNAAGTTVPDIIATTLKELDIDNYLSSAGATAEQLCTLRSRLSG